MLGVRLGRRLGDQLVGPRLDQGGHARIAARLAVGPVHQPARHGRVAGGERLPAFRRQPGRQLALDHRLQAVGGGPVGACEGRIHPQQRAPHEVVQAGAGAAAPPPSPARRRPTGTPRLRQRRAAGKGSTRPAAPGRPGIAGGRAVEGGGEGDVVLRRPRRPRGRQLAVPIGQERGRRDLSCSRRTRRPAGDGQRVAGGGLGDAPGPAPRGPPGPLGPAAVVEEERRARGQRHAVQRAPAGRRSRRPAPRAAGGWSAAAAARRAPGSPPGGAAGPRWRPHPRRPRPAMPAASHGTSGRAAAPTRINCGRRPRRLRKSINSLALASCPRRPGRRSPPPGRRRACAAPPG